MSIPLVYLTKENYRRMDVDAPNSFSRLDSFDEQWGLLRFNENSDQITERCSYDTFSSMRESA